MSNTEQAKAYHLRREEARRRYNEKARREYFTALALQGILANPASANRPAKDIATYAVQAADATIAKLNEPDPVPEKKVEPEKKHKCDRCGVAWATHIFKCKRSLTAIYVYCTSCSMVLSEQHGANFLVERLETKER